MDEQICFECNHPMSMHAQPYGCEFEFGDDENGAARGQCGCTIERAPAKREVEQAISLSGFGRSFLTMRRV